MKKVKHLVKCVGLSIAAMIIAGPVLAEADPEKGKKVFRKCSACHSVQPGEIVSGPSLHNIIGKKAGTHEAYKYSKAFDGIDIVWTEENLKTFLANPKKFLPKNKMIFRGLKKEKDLDNLLAYLKLQNK